MPTEVINPPDWVEVDPDMPNFWSIRDGEPLRRCILRPSAVLFGVGGPTMAKLTEYDICTNQPENLSVGQLNELVRVLRERNYQLMLENQALKPPTVKYSCSFCNDQGRICAACS